MLPEEFDWRHLLAAIVALTVIAAVAAAVPSLWVDFNPDVGRLAVVEMNGPITQSSGNTFQSEGITPDTVASLTEEAQDDGADAILYEINSPGGSVVASKDVARVIKDTDVPTVCQMKEVAASGGYWVASACDRIVADRLSLTGSIGVTSAYLEFSELLNRYGVEYVNLTSGEFKDMGSQYKNLTPEERDKFNELLDTVHGAFVEEVADNRNMSEDSVREVATGEIMLGQDAAEHGLVDELGSRDTAEEVVKELTNTSELKTTTYTPSQQFNVLSLLFSKIGEGMINGIRNEQQYGVQARKR